MEFVKVIDPYNVNEVVKVLREAIEYVKTLRNHHL